MRTVTLTFDVEDYYTIINSLREACGCELCKSIAEKMMLQRREIEAAK
jgi:hypothetical protein